MLTVLLAPFLLTSYFVAACFIVSDDNTLTVLAEGCKTVISNLSYFGFFFLLGRKNVEKLNENFSFYM